MWPSRAEQEERFKKHLIPPEAIELIPEEMARRYNVVPLDINGNVLTVAIADPSDIIALEALASRSQMRINPQVSTVSQIQEAIDFNYQSYEEIERQISIISLPSESDEEQISLNNVTEAPVAKALALIINEAVKARASDIHIQPDEDEVWVRYRIDGTLQDKITLPLKTSIPLISRIKILANMNIADRHRPQDGQFSIRADRHQGIDIRVGTVPTVHGEMAALRILNKSTAILPLTQLGFSSDTLTRFEEMIKSPYGMVMISGPTGAGKTTTLYAALNSLDFKKQNIITIEDPVEYRFKNINQVQVSTRAGLTFSSGLKSILRLDPDVILVGEIRDAETARIAVQSALTGHLVLSSIHANDAVGVILRLLDLGVEPFLVASALIGIVAQRMTRRICPDCATRTSIPIVEQMAYTKETGDNRREFLVGTGCKSCYNTGYQGRVGMFEMLGISEDLKSMILSEASTAELQAQATKEGMVPLITDGMQKVKGNITTPAEVLHNAYTTQ